MKTLHFNGDKTCINLDAIVSVEESVNHRCGTIQSAINLLGGHRVTVNNTVAEVIHAIAFCEAHASNQ